MLLEKTGITHAKTKWVLKDENGAELWSETDVNLKNIFLNRQSLVNKFMPDTTWTLEAIAIASDNTESELGKGTVYNKANADMFYKPEFISNKIEPHIKWRTVQIWRVKIRTPGALTSGTKIMPSKIRDFCNIVKHVYRDVVANKYPIDIIHWFCRASLLRNGVGLHWVGTGLLLYPNTKQDTDGYYNYMEAPFDIEIPDLNNVSDTVVAAIRNNVKHVKIYPNYNELLNMYVKFVDNTWYLYFEMGIPGIGTTADLNLPFPVRPGITYYACLMLNVKYIPSQYGTGSTGWTVNDGWQYTINPINKFMEGIRCEFRTTGITKGFGISSDKLPSPELSSISSAGMDIKYIENGISKTMPYGPDKLEYFFTTKTDLYLQITSQPFMNLDNGNLDPLPNNKDTVINYNNNTLGLQLEIWNYDLATKQATTMVPNVKQSFKPHLTAPDGMLGIEYPEPDDSVKLVHNQPYLIKMWFRPFNNSHFKNFCYVEKVMVAYDKNRLTDDNIDVTMFGHIFLRNQGVGANVPLIPMEQFMQCMFNNDSSKENIGYVGTAFVTFKDAAGTSIDVYENDRRDTWLSNNCSKLILDLKDQLSSSTKNTMAKEHTNISTSSISSPIDVKIHVSKNWANTPTGSKFVQYVYEGCLPYSCNRYYSSTYQNEVSNIGLPGNNVKDEAGEDSAYFNYREAYDKLKEGNPGELTHTHLMVMIIPKAKPGEKEKPIFRVFPLRMLSTTYSNAGLLKYCVTINNSTPGTSKSFSTNNVKEINYASVTKLKDLFTYFKYAPRVIGQFHGWFNTIIKKYADDAGRTENHKDTDIADMVLTNSNVMYNKYYKPTGILDPAQEYETLPVWHTDLKAKSWNVESIKAITPVPMFPTLIIDDMEKVAAARETDVQTLKSRFLSMIGSFVVGRTKSIRIHTEATAAFVIDRKGNNTYASVNNSYALSHTGYYYPNISGSYPTNPTYFSRVYFYPYEEYKTFRHSVIYPGNQIAPTLKIKNGPTSGEALKYPLVATNADAQLCMLPKPTVSIYVHTESNNVNDLDTNKYRGSVSHFWARPQNLGTNTDPVTFISEDCVSIFFENATSYTYYFLHMANPLKLCLANLPFIKPEALEVNVYKGSLPLPTTSELILAVKVYKFNKFIDKDLKLGSTSTADVKTYHEKIERIAYNATSSFMLRTDIKSKKHNVPIVYYRKGNINSPLMRLDRIPLTDSRLDPYKECDKYLREDTCGTPFMAKGVMGYYTFNSANTKFVSMDADGKNPYFDAEPYDLLVVRYPMVFGIKNNAAPYEQFVVYRVDPSTGEITSHPEDQGRVLPFLTRPYDFSGTETYGTVDVTKTVVAPRSNLGAEGMMMNHDTFGSILPPVVMGPNGPKLSS